MVLPTDMNRKGNVSVSSNAVPNEKSSMKMMDSKKQDIISDRIDMKSITIFLLFCGTA